MMSATAGALHHVFFFLEAAPLKADAPPAQAVTAATVAFHKISARILTDTVESEKAATSSDSTTGVTQDDISETILNATAASEQAAALADSDYTTGVAPNNVTMASIIAAGQCPNGDADAFDNPSDDKIQSIETPASFDDGSNSGNIFAKAYSILTAAATHATAGVETECAAAARKCAVATQNDVERAAETSIGSDQPNDIERIAPSTTANSVQCSSDSVVEAVTESELPSLIAKVVSDQPNQNGVSPPTSIATPSASEHSPEIKPKLEDWVIVDRPSEKAAEGLPKPEQPSLTDHTPAQDDSECAANGTSTQHASEHTTEVPNESKEPPLNGSMIGDKPYKTQNGPPSPSKIADINASKRATNTLPAQKQPSLIVPMTAHNPTQTGSGASSPSKTTPLSVSAAEFVPLVTAPPPPAKRLTQFGPELPPALLIAANAAEFVPSAKYVAPHHREPRHKPVHAEHVFFEQRESPGKGIGLFATRKIPIGTRIICEAPLLQIPENDISLTLEAYQNLPNGKKKIFNRLHAFAPKHLDLKRKVLTEIDGIDNSTLDKYVKVLSIFAANDFILADQIALGVFETASRINHSCIPNVHFTNNAELGGKQTVHAACDIEEGQELLANYIGAKSNYWPSGPRQEILSVHYGFQCQCESCSGAKPGSDSRRERLSSIVWGLNEYKYQDEKTSHDTREDPFFPKSRPKALSQAEDAYRLLLHEGLITTELAKAYRFASDFALGIGQYEKALEYAFFEHNIERQLFGKEVADLKELGVASDQWIAQIQQRMDENGAAFPLKSFWANHPDKQKLWYSVRSDEKKRIAQEEKLALVTLKKRELKKKRSGAKKTRERQQNQLMTAEHVVAEDNKPQEVQSLNESSKDKGNVDGADAQGHDRE